MGDPPVDRRATDSPAVTLSKGEAQELARLLTILTGESWLARPTDAEKDAVRSTPTRPEIIAKIEEAFLQRRKRADYFGNAMFGEPAWDMLLALYIHEHFGVRQQFGELVKQSGAPRSSGQRWLGYLETQRLVEREPHPTDARGAVIRLTEKGRKLLESYFETVISKPLPRS